MRLIFGANLVANKQLAINLRDIWRGLHGAFSPFFGLTSGLGGYADNAVSIGLVVVVGVAIMQIHTPRIGRIIRLRHGGPKAPITPTQQSLLKTTLKASRKLVVNPPLKEGGDRSF